MLLAKKHARHLIIQSKVRPSKTTHTFSRLSRQLIKLYLLRLLIFTGLSVSFQHLIDEHSILRPQDYSVIFVMCLYALACFGASLIKLHSSQIRAN